MGLGMTEPPLSDAGLPNAGPFFCGLPVAHAYWRPPRPRCEAQLAGDDDERVALERESPNLPPLRAVCLQLIDRLRSIATFETAALFVVSESVERGERNGTQNLPSQVVDVVAIFASGIAGVVVAELQDSHSATRMVAGVAYARDRLDHRRATAHR